MGVGRRVNAEWILVMDYSTTHDIELKGEEEGATATEKEYRESTVDVEIGPTEKSEEPLPPAYCAVIEATPEPQRRPSGRVSTDEVDNVMGESKGFFLCIGLVLASIAALLIVILVPLSFSDLEYYEVCCVLTKIYFRPGCAALQRFKLCHSPAHQL